jgi:hypothetical protein
MDVREIVWGKDEKYSAAAEQGVKLKLKQFSPSAKGRFNNSSPVGAPQKSDDIVGGCCVSACPNVLCNTKCKVLKHGIM